VWGVSSSDLLDFAAVAWVWPIRAEVFMQNLRFLGWFWELSFYGWAVVEYENVDN
jgi:hypothetical protein